MPGEREKASHLRGSKDAGCRAIESENSSVPSQGAASLYDGDTPVESHTG